MWYVQRYTVWYVAKYNVWSVERWNVWYWQTYNILYVKKYNLWYVEDCNVWYIKRCNVWYVEQYNVRFELYKRDRVLYGVCVIYCSSRRCTWAFQIHEKSQHSIKRDLYSVKRALCSIKRALLSLHIGNSKEMEYMPSNMWKETYQRNQQKGHLQKRPTEEKASCVGFFVV